MRKQQLRIATGGAVVCMRWGACNATPENWGTTTASLKLACMALMAMGAGTSYLSRDCWSARQWAWHKAGCASSIAIDMDSAQGMPLAITIPPSVPLVTVEGHTYRATANCINSRLHSAKNTVIRRVRRRMDIEVSLVRLPKITTKVHGRGNCLALSFDGLWLL